MDLRIVCTDSLVESPSYQPPQVTEPSLGTIRSRKRALDSLLTGPAARTGRAGPEGYNTSRASAAHVMGQLKSSIPRRRDAIASLVLKRARRGLKHQDPVHATLVQGRMDGTNGHQRRHRRPQHLPWTGTLIDHGLCPSCKGRGSFPPSVWRCGNPSPSRYFERRGPAPL